MMVLKKGPKDSARPLPNLDQLDRLPRAPNSSSAAGPSTSSNPSNGATQDAPPVPPRSSINGVTSGSIWPQSTGNPIKAEPNSLVYFHAHIITKADAYEILQHYQEKPGSFLLRSSQSRPGEYTITVTHRTGIKHITIDSDGSRYYLSRDQSFTSISELIHYYSIKAVFNEDGIDELYLTNPIHCYGNNKNCPPRASSQNTERNATSRGKSDTSDKLLNILGLKPRSQAQGSHQGKEAQKQLGPAEINKNGSYVTTASRLTMAEKLTANVNVPGEKEAACLGDKPYYSDVANEEHSILYRIIAQLETADSSESDKCECGLKLDESQLPRGWSVHISREQETYGRIFFLNPDGTTSWLLPLVVCLDLEPEQQEMLRDLIRASDTYLTVSQQQNQPQSVPHQKQQEQHTLQQQQQYQPQLQQQPLRQQRQQEQHLPGQSHQLQQGQERQKQIQQQQQVQQRPHLRLNTQNQESNSVSLINLTRTSTLDSPVTPTYTTPTARKTTRADSVERKQAVEEDGDSYGIVSNQISSSSTVISSAPNQDTSVHQRMKIFESATDFSNRDAGYLKKPPADKLRPVLIRQKPSKTCQQPAEFTNRNTPVLFGGTECLLGSTVRRSNTVSGTSNDTETHNSTQPQVPPRRSRTMRETTSRVIKTNNDYMPMNKSTVINTQL